MTGVGGYRGIIGKGISFGGTDGIGTPSSDFDLDPDAEAFILSFNNETSSTMGATQQSALNNRVLRMKGILTDIPHPSKPIWSKIHADYPMCPIDSSSASLDGFKLNLVDPRDLDAAFRISWFNSPPVSTSGITGNNSGYGDTHFNPSTDSTQNSFGLNNKCVTDNTASGQVEMGIRRSTQSLSSVINRFFGGDLTIWASNCDWSDWVSTSTSNNSEGIFHSERTSSNLLTGYQDGVSRGTNTAPSELNVNGNIYVLARNLQGSGAEAPCNGRTYTSFGLHQGLDSDEVENYEYIINQFDIEAR